MKHEEAIGLFYGAGLFLGVGGGIAAGFLYHHIIYGGIVGGIIGIGLGLLAHAFVALKQQ
jgi:hypothetical protein